MKKIIILTAAIAVFTGCKMDDIPLENMPPEIAFQDSVRVEYFVNELYPYLNAGVSYNRLGGGGTGGSMFECITDLAVYSPTLGQAEVNKFILGTLNAATGGNPDARWAELYQAIRKCNVVLLNLPYLSKVSQARWNRFRGEALFMKATNHFELVKRYGGIPIMDDILDLNKDINIPRSTFEECIDYITGLLDEAASLLPTVYPANHYGRITKGAAIGLKSKVLLFAASPLFNEHPLSNSTELQRYASADPKRWDLAAEAALEVINLRNPDGSKTHELYPSYQRVFFDRENNRENIIMKQQGKTNNVEKANAPTGFQNARGNTNATLELINLYELKSGKLPADDPDYNPQKPYENRCNRFYATILYNGAELWGRSVEFFRGGRDYPANPGQKGCVTGFNMFKHIDPLTSIVSPEKTTYHDWPVLRYAEVLLIYAEARNEYLGMGDDDPVTDDMIYTCVNAVRARAGLPAVSDLTRGEMRTLIHRERTVELAFEDARYHDLRRWREAETVLNQPVHGVVIEKKEDNSFLYQYEENGKPIEVENRIFPMNCYYYFIPQSEMDKNKALVNNPGW